MGPVFRGDDPRSRTPVVIKVFRLNVTPERARIVVDELATLRRALPVHPGIAPTTLVGSSDVEPYVVSACVAGKSLDVMLRERGPATLAGAMKDERHSASVAVSLAGGRALP